MGAALDETRVALTAQRARVRATAERLESEARRAVDLPGRIRKRPLPALAVAAAVGFVVLGGPRRVLRAIRRAAGGARSAETAYRALPAPLQALVDTAADRSGGDPAQARGELARALHEWRADPRNRRRAERLANQALVPPGPDRAFWAVAEAVGLAVGAVVARRLAARWLAGEPLRPRPADRVAPAPPAPAGERREPPVGYSGWSGRRVGSTPGDRPG